MLESLVKKIKNFRKKPDSRLKPNMEIPGTPESELSNRTDISIREDERESLENDVNELLHRHPKIGPTRIHVETTNEGYPKQITESYAQNPVLEPNKTIFLWGPDINEEKMILALQNAGKDINKLRGNHTELFKEEATKCWRATYLPQNIREIAEEKKMSSVFAREIFESYKTKTGEDVISDIDWKKAGKDTIRVNVGRKTSADNKVEQSIQIIEDQVEGVELYKEGAKGISELISEFSIPVTDKTTNEEKCALVLKYLEEEYSKKSPKKTRVVCYREDDVKPETALRVAKHMGIETVYPIFDYEQFEKMESKRKHDPYKKLKKGIATAGMALIGLGAFAGLEYKIIQFAVQTGNVRAVEKIEKMKAQKPTEKTNKANTTGLPTGKFNFNYSPKKGTIKITLEAKDSDGIEKVLVRMKNGYNIKDLIDENNYKGKKKKVTETYSDSIGSTWKKGNAYEITVRIEDKLGNIKEFPEMVTIQK